MKDLRDFTADELTGFVKSLGYPAYRAAQIREWLNRGAASFDEMLNIPKDMRLKLAEIAAVELPKAVSVQTAADGTVKVLWELRDGAMVESVLMKYKHGNSACLSTQAGCKMNCAFCASAVNGFARNLTAGEMLSQITGMERLTGRKTGRVVLMGIGEPLDNIDNVLRFLKQAASGDGLNIGARHISVSTCGLPGGIAKLAQSGIPVTLSVSLHAPDDETRSELMPVNGRYGVDAVLKAADEYFKVTSRRVSYEYILIDGVNDGEGSAKLLARKLRGKAAHVNLIAYNPIENKPYTPSRRVKSFQQTLEAEGVAVTVRRRLGRGIDAACGQLKFLKEATL